MILRIQTYLFLPSNDISDMTAEAASISMALIHYDKLEVA